MIGDEESAVYVLGCLFLGFGPLLNRFATKSDGDLFVTSRLILGFRTNPSYIIR